MPQPINSSQTESSAFKKLGNRQTKPYIVSEAILEQMNPSTQKAQTSSKQVSDPFFTSSSRTSRRRQPAIQSPGDPGGALLAGGCPAAASAEQLPPPPRPPPGLRAAEPQPRRSPPRRVAGLPVRNLLPPQPASAAAARKGPASPYPAAPQAAPGHTGSRGEHPGKEGGPAGGG